MGEGFSLRITSVNEFSSCIAEWLSGSVCEREFSLRTASVNEISLCIGEWV